MTVAPLDTSRLDLSAAPEGYVRSEGVHVSDLYNRLYAELEPDRYADDGSGPNVEKMALGSRFEEALERELARHYFGRRPPEQVMPHRMDCPNTQSTSLCACGGGVAFSPDYVWGEILGEFKCTWQSVRTYEDTSLSPKADKWVCQMQAYCWGLGLTQAELYVFFVNGDYKHPYTPELRAWTLQFTERELDDNWRLLVRTGQRHGMIPTDATDERTA